MNRLFYYVVFFVFIISPFGLSSSDNPNNAVICKITVNNNLFTFIKSLKKVDVISQDNKNVFHSESKDEYEVILNVGYSTNLESFYAFKNQLDNNTQTSRLLLETEMNEYEIITNSETSFYSPVLIDHNSTYILFVTENFSIVVYDFQTEKIIKQVNSNVPIIKLKKSNTENSVGIEFLVFHEGTYIKQYIKIDSLLYNTNIKIPNLNFVKNIEKPATSQLTSLFSPLSLSYSDFLCFGDSITYGYINKKPAQTLGYVPRLDKMINENLYTANIINEGHPGTQTHEVVGIFDDIIKKYNAKCLLFHYGTNDAIHMETPISSIIFNIRYMIEKSINYGMYPIISTLIPRNGWTGEGILRIRAVQINNRIKTLSDSLQTPIIDFWDIFSSYPA